MLTLNSAMHVSASGLSAGRTWMDTISTNIANANSVQIGNKEPWRRQDVELQGGPEGVRVVNITKDQSPFVKKYDPTNRNRDIDGNVLASNVEPVIEMVNMIAASRSYEANVAAFNTVKGMIKSALNIGKV